MIHGKYFLCSALVILFITGCKEENPVDTPEEKVGIVENVYGIGYHRAVSIGWAFSSSAIGQFGVYRHSGITFSYGSAVRIGTVPVTARPGIVDTGLVNGTLYYYTVVPEALRADSSFVKGLGVKTIPLTPNDHQSLPAELLIYSQHIQPIFNSSCAVHGCHVGSEHRSFQRTLSGTTHFDLTSWAKAMSGTDDVAQIVPYRSSKSHLIRHLNTDTLVAPVATPAMPPGFAFPSAVRDMLIRWIDDGAKNDDGIAAYSTMPSRGWAYVTNQGEDLTAVIDLDRNKIARYITTGLTNTKNGQPMAPHNVAVDRQNQFYYVNLIKGNRLLKFSVAGNVKSGELSTGLSSPAQVALSKGGDTAYVSNFEDGKTNISVVNTATMTKIGDINSPAILKPHGVSITPDFQYVISANSLSDNVSVIRTSDHSVAATIPLSGNVPALPINYVYRLEPYQSVITPDSRYVYVTCRKGGEVRVIDLQLMKVIDSIAVGQFPLIPAVTPSGDRVFVANRNSKSVSAINTATRKVDFVIENVGIEPHGIDVSKDGMFLYVSCENQGISEPPHHATSGGTTPSFLKVIDLASRKVVTSLEMGNFGSGMAVTH